MIRKPLGAVLFAFAIACYGTACAEIEDHDEDEEVETSTDALGRTCYCAGKAACTSSKNAIYMYPGARAALAAAGVPESALTQTFGDAAASVGTHCPEPGKSYSAASDLVQGPDPCGRVRKMRMQGFAAWFRTAPEFPGNLHIHAVYAGTPAMKASLERQVASFLAGRDGLARNEIDGHCPITEAEKAAVRRVQSGGASACVAGGTYCGGGKVKGDPSTLYRCNATGAPTVVEVCTNGCTVNPGRNDSCM
ncbi:MAG: hypothetical protein KIT84_41415 [Labilithrix sp.]|nr:hypothetical protein [Labilithrix sp.]MCW5817531.1 hypothetical protein [Labilithrix sp.]